MSITLSLSLYHTHTHTLVSKILAVHIMCVVRFFFLGLPSREFAPDYAYIGMRNFATGLSSMHMLPTLLTYFRYNSTHCPPRTGFCNISRSPPDSSFGIGNINTRTCKGRPFFFAAAAERWMYSGALQIAEGALFF